MENKTDGSGVPPSVQNSGSGRFFVDSGGARVELHGENDLVGQGEIVEALADLLAGLPVEEGQPGAF